MVWGQVTLLVEELRPFLGFIHVHICMAGDLSCCTQHGLRSWRCSRLDMAYAAASQNHDEDMSAGVGTQEPLPVPGKPTTGGEGVSAEADPPMEEPSVWHACLIRFKQTQSFLTRHDVRELLARHVQLAKWIGTNNFC